jgi:hypothetical protein
MPQPSFREIKGLMRPIFILAGCLIETTFFPSEWADMNGGVWVVAFGGGASNSKTRKPIQVFVSLGQLFASYGTFENVCCRLHRKEGAARRIRS